MDKPIYFVIIQAYSKYFNKSNPAGIMKEVIMNGKICFFEPDKVLAERLVDYWLSHGLAQYNICYYSDAGKWMQDASSLFADLWILDCSLRAVIEAPPPGRVIWWTDQPEDADSVFKYRSAVVLLHTIQGYLQGDKFNVQVTAEAQLISLYSPVKRCLQTTFGITLAHLLSKKGRTLYLNLEGYSGMDRTLAGSISKDISDFIYYVNQSTNDNIPLILQKYIYRLEEVDIIPPVLNPCNLQDVTEDMWRRMLHTLQKSGLYDYIIVDVSDFIHGTFTILRESQMIFSLTKSDERASAKWQQYCSVLEESGYSDVLDKTRRSELPQVTLLPAHLEEYMPGPMTELVTQAAKEAGLL